VGSLPSIEQMEPNATSEVLAVNMDNPASNIQDFAQVVELYWPRIFRFILASVRDRGEAEGLTQDCFCKAYKAWMRFRGDSSVDTWLMHIAINVVRDFARNRRLQFWRRAPSIDAADFSDWIADRNLSPEANAVIQQQLERIWAVTEILPLKQRTVFLLRFVEEMELSEIAKAMGIGEGSVKVHLFRAVHTIRKRLRRSP
jgi:RNA polymerase sigma-70 factor (ECF subfamily)